MKSILFLAIAKLFLAIKTLLPLNTFLAFVFPFTKPTEVLLQRVTVDLSSAQILALDGTPVTVVPAPGVGSRIVPFLTIIHMIGGGVAYTDAGVAVSLSAGSANYPLTDNNIFLVTVSPNKRSMTMGFAEVLDTAANPQTSDNAPLQIGKITNNFAAGTGTARVTVYFAVEPTS